MALHGHVLGADLSASSRVRPQAFASSAGKAGRTYRCCWLQSYTASSGYVRVTGSKGYASVERTLRMQIAIVVDTNRL
eukprot:359944-Chlamydomonas_euryale.AAC.5